MEKMLINATHADELRVAIVKDDYLYDLDIERPDQEKKKANIYKGKITRVEPSLEAAFVEFGSKRQGFLPLKEIAPEYQRKAEGNSEGGRPSIKELVREGQEVMIQVEKDERGNKGAALTSYITLAGCYLVLMPNNPKAGGISRRIEGDDRDQLRTTLDQMTVPEGMSVIIRTAGVGKKVEDLQWDLDVLVNQWHAIKKVFNQRQAPFLIHQEGDVVIRSIRDNLRRECDEIIIDKEEVFIKAKRYIEQVKPDLLGRVKLYQDPIPLFSRHGMEAQIETAYQREVQLPSGGSIVIDRTEALVSIDINSARSTAGTDIEMTAFNNNLEAADEIARQLRLRDLGGLIVIDFIDMNSSRNQREVENRLREALRPDRARVQVGRISRFGLLEMSRQRLRLSLGESSQTVCPTCYGRGTIRTVQSLANTIMRLIEEEALKDKTGQIQVQVPVPVATFLSNEKRDMIALVERRLNVEVLIIANPYTDVPEYKIIRLRQDELPNRDKSPASYDLISQPEPEVVTSLDERRKKVAEPAVKHTQAVRRPEKQQEGLLTKLWRSLFGTGQSKQKKQQQQGKSGQKNRGNQHHNRRRSNQNRNKRRRSGGHYQQRRGGGSGGNKSSDRDRGGVKKVANGD